MSRKRQRNLFEEPGTGGNWLERPPLNPRPRLKEAIRQMLSGCRFSRPQIAERMNRAFKAEGLPNRVSVPRLDAWAADSKANLPETVELPVLCWAAESALRLAALNGCLQAAADQRGGGAAAGPGPDGAEDQGVEPETAAPGARDRR